MRGGRMRSVCVNLPGGLENISIAEIEEPRAGPGQVLVQVAYAACNWGDIQKRQGIYPDPMTYPLFLGGEASGIVVSVGKGVSGLEPGQPVALISGPDMRMTPREQEIRDLLLQSAREMSRLLNCTEHYPPHHVAELD